MRKLLLLIFILFFNNAYSQQDTVNTTEKEAAFLSLIYANRQLTYLTLFEGFGNLPPLLTEMGFSGSYFLKKNDVWALEANLNMVLRIRNENSFPVSPPSYNPVLTYYREMNSWDDTFLSKLLLDHAYWEVSIGHHSNGKAGHFYIIDSLGNRTNGIDFENANFSTDYLELAFTTFNYHNGSEHNFISNFRLAGRYYLPILSSAELKGMYGFYRFFASYNIFGFPWRNTGKWFGSFFTKSRLRLHSGWIFGDMENASPDAVGKRLIGDVTWFYYPGWLSELGFFIQYYRGQDYYNVHFRRTIEMLRIGISSNPINFGVLNDL